MSIQIDFTREEIRAYLTARGIKHHQQGKEFRGPCPIHHGKRESFAVNQATGLWKCHSECDRGGSLFGLEMELSGSAFSDALAEVFRVIGRSQPNGTQKERLLATYDYTDEQGQLLFQCVRFHPKEFRQRRPNGPDRWIWNLEGVRRVLYRLPKVLAAELVLVVEGEKDVHALERLGFTATTNPMGAGKWRDEFNDTLAGKRVVIFPDTDAVGQRHAEKVRQSLTKKARSVAIGAIGLGKDVSDWISAGAGKADIETAIEKAEQGSVHEPEADRGHAGCNWPDPLDEKAFYGLAGEIVRVIEPHSEADPAALLVQLLVAFGNLIGRRAHFTAEADSHFTNLFAVIVGQTSKGRKGSSLGQVQYFLQSVDTDWRFNNNTNGLSTGEGLIWAVHDQIEEDTPVKEKGRVLRYERVVKDEGIADKRLLVLEPEFARVLTVAERKENTLSSVIRQCFDTGDLRVMTREKTAEATHAHISIIGHITKDELKRLLNETAMANGFANRFLWICARRSQLLPEGGEMHKVDITPWTRRLMDAAAFAKNIGRMSRDPEAKEFWREIYGKLSEGKPGLFGAVTSRAEVITMRLACSYALLDLSDIVRKAHLEAAYAVWRYSQESARFLFGDRLGDPTADEILQALRNQRELGMSRNDIRELFQRNKSSDQIGRALSVLQEYGLARMETEQREEKGRPTEVWFAL